MEHRSGLAALSGQPSGDMRTLLERRTGADAPAMLAVSVYVHRLRAKIAAMAAAMAAAMSRLGALVFTGGIGENSPLIRAETCDRLGWLGVEVDEAANTATAGDDADISAAGAPVATVVVHAREDLVIAADCRRLLAGPSEGKLSSGSPW